MASSSRMEQQFYDECVISDLLTDQICPPRLPDLTPLGLFVRNEN
jgi:hypothetical protein